MTPTCGRPDLNHLVPQYVAGRLPPEQLELVELHLLECTPCWEEARLGTALRKGRRSSRRRRAVWLGGWAAAAVLAALFLWPARNPYAELGRIDVAPRFRPAATRAGGSGSVAIIDSGMVAYQRGDYRAAERLLAHGAAETSQPGAFFFLGVSRLLLRRPAEAVEALRRAEVPEGNAFEAEARLYLAKAFLQLGLPDSALAHLRGADSSAAMSPEAAALRRAIQQVGRSR